MIQELISLNQCCGDIRAAVRIQDILDSSEKARASLVIQWIRIHLPMKGTQVQSLVWKDSRCQGATKAYVLQFPQSPPPITSTPRGCSTQEKPP